MLCDCRLVEESDFELASELFGDAGADLEKFMPKTAKEFELYAQLVSGKYLTPYKVQTTNKTDCAAYFIKLLLNVPFVGKVTYFVDNGRPVECKLR